MRHGAAQKAERSSALHDCAVQGVLAATVASATYAVEALALAQSSHQVGFPCLAVQAFQRFKLLKNPLLRSIDGNHDPPTLLPRPCWCNLSRYGWRRSHLYRARMWRVVLQRGFHLLAVDLDWRFTRNPVSWLLAMRTRDGRAVDVLPHQDGKAGLLNVGLMFVRSSWRTIALARRVENRSFGGWEQGIFNEEVSWGELGWKDGLACCHCSHDAALERCTTPSMLSTSANTSNAHLLHRLSTHDKGKRPILSDMRQRAEGQDVCTADLPPTLGPPPDSRLRWVAFDKFNLSTPGRKGWLPDAYNQFLDRKLGLIGGNCSRADNLCACCTETAR